MRFRLWVLILSGVLGVAFAANAFAAKPVKEPFEMERLEFPAGQVCPFPILIEPIESESNWAIKTFKDGRMLVTGTGTTAITNVDTGASTVIRESGSIRITPVSDGHLYEFAGRFGLYFFEGDEPAGAGMFLAIGRVTEVLGEDDVVTFFEMSGQQRDLCAHLSG